jgi:hypothetical protein
VDKTSRVWRLNGAELDETASLFVTLGYKRASLRLDQKQAGEESGAARMPLSADNSIDFHGPSSNLRRRSIALSDTAFPG